MRLSIFHKIYLSLLLSSLLLLLGMGWLINTSFKEGLQNYINDDEAAKVAIIANKIVAYYSDSYQWTRLQQSPHLLSSFIQQVGEIPAPKQRPFGLPKRQPNRHQPPPPTNPSSLDDEAPPPLPREATAKVEPSFFVPLGMRLSLVDTEGRLILGDAKQKQNLKPEQIIRKIEINKDGKLVGWFHLVQQTQVSGKLARSFLYSQSQHILTITIAALLLSLLSAFLLVRYLLQPLQALHKGTEAVEHGDLDYVVKRNSNDEIGEIIASFNQLTATLKQQKQMREQWLSDISHELRTPIAVLQGELEAMQDGIRPMNQKAIDSLHSQVRNLTSLVNDLHTLSLSDANVELFRERHNVSLAELLEPCCDRYRLRLAEKSIRLLTEFEHLQQVTLQLDSKRIQQVFNNLLENSYRYTDSGGLVRVSIHNLANHVSLVVEDSSPGVPSDSLPRLFDRLYRVDKSRSRINGGSGLGLSICQSIVLAHGGHISASHSDIGGVKITVTLPK
ncbi:ATP-binding protein [Vibrio hippocampi]|uniref:histidine kinase n=1 Tax=Vibrio hippocampi TaxID=654686 RepID=A0ABM8ZMG0_9VIBR|nr:ATP-binding protein [Vibrio hippocampi]CAH0529727.1 Signal transduction histidine-protein kinase BaeS [Vibrio hippocampi]